MRPTALALALPLLLAACGGTEPPPTVELPAGERVESPALGIAIAALPADLTVTANEGPRLVLVPADGSTGGITFEVDPPARGGVNLVEAVNLHKAAIEAQPEGSYQGQIELGGPLGTAFASRGRFTGEDGAVEELRIFTIHPAGDRMLTLVYTYPPGETEARRDQLLTLFGEVEGLGTPAEVSGGPVAGSG